MNRLKIEVDDKFLEKIDEALAKLKKSQININENYVVVNEIFSYWDDFILNHSEIGRNNLEKYKNLQTPEEKIIFIRDKYPEYQLITFWALIMLKILKEQR